MNDSKPQHPILPDILALAERSLEQAKQSLEVWMVATYRAVATIEHQTGVVRSNVLELQRKAMDFADHNVAASFDFAQNLSQARAIEEIGRLHTEFVNAQVKALSEQARELARHVAKTPERARQTR